jgi:uncharacterized RDD family membrane protein YckC
MHSAQPEDSNLVNDVSQSVTEQDAWRALVSSRVSRYRALRKPKSSAGANLPALDFGPASEPPSPDSADVIRHALASRQTEAGTSARASRGAFDTNYYRRLNAESLNAGPYSQGSSALQGAMATAPMNEPEAESALMSTEIAEDLNEPQMIDLELRPEVSGDPGLDRYCIAAPEPEMAVDLEPVAEAQTEIEIEPEPAPKPEPLTQGNLIVFRRPLIEPPLVPQPSRDELAEPMHNRPRILEVPEDIMPAVQGSLFPEIRLDSNESESSAPREPEIEVPLAVAQVGDRLMAGLLDAGVVMAATVLFAAIAWTGLPGVPHTKPFFMIIGAVSLLLWAVYQHLFLLYAGRTVGMSLRGIRLSTFDGHTPEWKQRSSRARFMFISMASVMLGFLWAMVDEDMLCWHDRISRTFPTTSI